MTCGVSINKVELRKYNKFPDVERAKLMMRDSLPANVSDEALANALHGQLIEYCGTATC